MALIPPELREDTGEIEAALQNRLPEDIPLFLIFLSLWIWKWKQMETTDQKQVQFLKEVCLFSLCYDSVNKRKILKCIYPEHNQQNTC